MILDALITSVKAVFIILLIAVTLLALPKIIEQATSDNQVQPYSGATPDCPEHIDDDEWVVPTHRY